MKKWRWFNINPGEWSYVILDDDMDGHMDHLVQTDFDVGLIDEDCERAISLLLGRMS